MDAKQQEISVDMGVIESEGKKLSKIQPGKNTINLNIYYKINISLLSFKSMNALIAIRV